MTKNKDIVKICCPICFKKKEIQIPSDLKDKSKSLITISIPINYVCDHTFQAFIDKDYQVRGYQKVDFELALYNNNEREIIEKQLLTDEDFNNAAVIKWNFSPEILIYILRCIIFNKKMVIIISDSNKSLIKSMESFLNTIFWKNFKIEVIILLKTNYDKIKSDFKNDIVLSPKKILNDKQKILNSKKIGVERKIIDNFYKEDRNYALIELEKKISDLYIISQYVIEIIDRRESKAFYNKFDIIDCLRNNYGINIEIQYFNLIRDIIRYYHKKVINIEEDKVEKFLQLL